MNPMAVCGPSANVAAHARQASPNSSSATTRSTMPSRNASSASTVALVANSSNALDDPTRWASNHGPPKSPENPSRAHPPMNRADDSGNPQVAGESDGHACSDGSAVDGSDRHDRRFVQQHREPGVGGEMGYPLLAGRSGAIGAPTAALPDIATGAERTPLAGHDDASDRGVCHRCLDGSHHRRVHVVVERIASVRAVERDDAHPTDDLDAHRAGFCGPGAVDASVGWEIDCVTRK